MSVLCLDISRICIISFAKKKKQLSQLHDDKKEWRIYIPDLEIHYLDSSYEPLTLEKLEEWMGTQKGKQYTSRFIADCLCSIGAFSLKLEEYFDSDNWLFDGFIACIYKNHLMKDLVVSLEAMREFVDGQNLCNSLNIRTPKSLKRLKILNTSICDLMVLAENSDFRPSIYTCEAPKLEYVKLTIQSRVVPLQRAEYIPKLHEDHHNYRTWIDVTSSRSPMSQNDRYHRLPIDMSFFQLCCLPLKNLEQD
jgi:hypothetical protein